MYVDRMNMIDCILKGGEMEVRQISELVAF